MGEWVITAVGTVAFLPAEKFGYLMIGWEVLDVE